MILPTASIETVLFDVVDALRIPVLLAVLLALAIAVVELGSLAAELRRRRKRTTARLETQALSAREALDAGDRTLATQRLTPVATSSAMNDVFALLIVAIGKPRAESRMAKALADFDLASLRRLERTRLLVRAGPALGLMGTLIPLSPALAGLAGGDIEELSDNLRVAFSITVVGLLTGAIGFGISLIRDRMYAQDLSDLEFVAATLTDEDDA